MNNETNDGGATVPCISLLDNIMAVFRDTPYLDKSYMCHGEPHFYSVPDYDRIEAQIAALLSNAHADLPAFAGTVRRIVGFVFVFTGGGVAALNSAGMCPDFSFEGSSWFGVISAVLIAVCGFLISQPNAALTGGEAVPSNGVVQTGGAQ